MKYNRAPITEAVLELRFTQPLARKLLEDGASRIAAEYFYSEDEQSINVVVEQTGSKVNTTWEGKKLSSLDRADTLIFRTASFVCSRLAPYADWESFIGHAQAGWEALKKAGAVPTISRIGLRYVNRIDIPVTDGELLNVEDFLYLVPRTPQALAQPMLSYVMQQTRPLGLDECNVLLTSATVPSPLVGCMSVGLDLDVFRDANIPMREDELWSLIHRMRNHKNFVFESCVTDRARALFQ